MKGDGKDNKKPAVEEKKKKDSRSRKVNSAFGGLPSMEDARQVTTDSDSGVARSMGGLAVAPAPPQPGLHHMGGLPGMQPGMARPSHFGAKMAPLPAGIMAQGGKGSSRVASGTAGRVEPYGWTFQDVPTLPQCHPLERTAVFVPHSGAPQVGRRIADVLRERSITAVYNDDKARAKCITEHGVEFNVRLYRGRDKFSHGIICEVQRRFGFCPSFAQDTYAILDAAEGKPPAVPEQTFSLVPPPVKLVAPSAVVSDDDDDFDDFDSDFAFTAPPSAGKKRKMPGDTSLRIASDMLKNAKTADAHVLALEGLARLTDSEKVGATTAFSVSRQILDPSNEQEQNVRNAVVSLLVDDSLADAAPESSDIWDKDDDGRAELRQCAVKTFCNAVSAVASSPGSSPDLLEEQSDFLADDVVPTLVSDLRESKKNPRMAVMAARCLGSLVTSKAVGGDVFASARECGAEAALSTALDVGQRGNKHLEEASKECLKITKIRC